MRLKSKVRRKGKGQIFSVAQPLSYSFACHVSCKVKYFGKVTSV